MGSRIPTLLLSASALLAFPTDLFAGKHGFADKEGGGKNDPVIVVSGSIGPDEGAVFSLNPDQANSLYAFTGATFGMTQTPPVIPQNSTGRNHFLTIKFPFKISSKKVKKTIMKDKGGPRLDLVPDVEHRHPRRERSAHPRDRHHRRQERPGDQDQEGSRVSRSGRRTGRTS